MSISDFQDTPINSGSAKLEQSNRPVITVLDYIEKCIPDFIKDSKVKKIRNEKGLTQRIVRILTTNFDDAYPFFFDKEGMEDETTGKSAAVDIDVIAKEIINVRSKIFQKGNRFFAFEAKILGLNDKLREKEYLIGHLNNKGKYILCGGIERFKKSIHGNGLDQCGMIGYMFTNDFNYWNKQINNWIDEFIKVNPDIQMMWSETDKLSLRLMNHQKAKYISNHSRSLKNKRINPIEIYHIWINLT